MSFVLFEGCYPDSTDLLQHVVNKTFMILSSVGICQEICYRRNGYRFAVKVCIDKIGTYGGLFNYYFNIHFFFLIHSENNFYVILIGHG